MSPPIVPIREYLLLGLLAVLWGSSYLFIRIAVAEIPPVTLIALRVAGAALVLSLVLVARGRRLPRGAGIWARLGLQSILNSIGAWTVLAWGQQFVGAGLASVLNSTSPLFVVLITAFITRHEALAWRRALGALVAFGGVILIIGMDALAGFGDAVAGQLACLAGAALYAFAAIHGRRFKAIGALETALGTMTWATVVLVPLAFVLEDPLALRPGLTALGATLILSVFCTGCALLIYFRLLGTIGALGTASQAYLRAGIGVLLGAIILGEVPTWPVLIGLTAAIVGVILIVAPARRKMSP
ncbi:MAG: DMT family transporter [Pseudomonadota bacterium]